MLHSPPAVVEPVASDVDGTRATRRTVLLASLVGTTVEWYDFFLYATAASMVFSRTFFPSANPTVGTLLSFATFAVGFVMRPVGGFVFGHIGDRIGRKRSLALTMLLMGGGDHADGRPAHGGSGRRPGARSCCWPCESSRASHWAGNGPGRCCWPSSTVRTTAEVSTARRRRSGWLWGWRWAPAAFALLQTLLPEQAFLSYGWRIAFLVSLVLVIFGFVGARCGSAETPAFQAM